jgi:hypothetical protein
LPSGKQLKFWTSDEDFKSFRQLFFRLQKKSCFFWLFFFFKQKKVVCPSINNCGNQSKVLLRNFILSIFLVSL